MTKVGVAILGSGNIGTDLLMKLARSARLLEPLVLVGIDSRSDGLVRARRMGVLALDGGLASLTERREFERVALLFDATSARGHVQHAAALAACGRRVIDLTPAALGPYTVPVVNLEENLGAHNLNMVTCGGQATIPIVAAIRSVTRIHYAEIVASIASRSAGPATRANIDEFTQTTALALEKVGGASRAKAIILLNPAEPPLVMRDTVLVLSEPADEARIASAIDAMVARVRRYVPGYQLKQPPQFERFAANQRLHIQCR